MHGWRFWAPVCLMGIAAACIALPRAALAARRVHARGFVQITGAGVGAVVRIDDKMVGKTPLNKPIALRPGPHRVAITKLGHLGINRRVRIRAGRTQKLQVDLLPVAGILVVRTDTAGAIVLVDGKEVGPAPLQREVTIGDHHVVVVVRPPQGKPFDASLSFMPGQEHVLVANFAPPPEPGDPLADMPLDVIPMPPRQIAPPQAQKTAQAQAPAADDDPLALEPLPQLAAPAAPDGASPTPVAAATEPPPLPTIDLATPISLPVAPNPAFADSPSTTAGVEAVMSPPPAWYAKWWVWCAAGAVLAGGATLTAVLLRDGGQGEASPDQVLAIHFSTEPALNAVR